MWLTYGEGFGIDGVPALVSPELGVQKISNVMDNSADAGGVTERIQSETLMKSLMT